jgi:hypothetical protein
MNYSKIGLKKAELRIEAFFGKPFKTGRSARKSKLFEPSKKASFWICSGAGFRMVEKCL